MPRTAALLLAVLLAWALGRIAPAGASLRVSALALGFALVAAALAGTLLEKLRLPRVTGYLLFGMLCGPYLGNIITRPMARELQIINGLAVTLIAFIAGLEMNLERLAPRLRAMLRLGGTTMALMYVALFVLFWITWPWLRIAPDLTGLQRFAVAALLTTLVASFSPTVTIALIAESRASGPLSELTLAVVVFADLLLILVFTLIMQGVRTAFGGEAEVGLLMSVMWEIFGSFAFGAAAGALFAMYLKFIGREVPLALIAFCATVTAAGDALHLEPLLSALAAGLVVENIAPPRGDSLKLAVEHGALPVLVIFFAAAGASLQIDALATIGWVAVAVSLARMLFIWSGARLGIRAAGLGPGPSQMVWMGLVSQAGVTLGLTLIVAAEYPAWGVQIQTLMVSLIALHQLIGPVLFRAALARAGEIGAMNQGSTESLITNP
jgi:Kef-type K+ transport system membrane component KefB